jgi:hypothetical protein
MKVLCKISLHDWEVMEQVYQEMNRVTVTQYKICKKCETKRFLGTYQYWKKSELNSIINYLSLN